VANPNPRKDVGFQKGNQAAKGNAGPVRRMMTQQLTSLLNEGYQGFKREARAIKDKDGKAAKGSDGKPLTEVVWVKDGKVADAAVMSNMRKVLENLVFNATVLNDQTAINAIFDRMEGKPAQAIVAEDENGNRLAATRFILEFDPASPAPKRAPVVTPALPKPAAETSH
jgi:hypothetical protein